MEWIRAAKARRASLATALEAYGIQRVVTRGSLRLVLRSTCLSSLVWRGRYLGLESTVFGLASMVIASIGSRFFGSAF